MLSTSFRTIKQQFRPALVSRRLLHASYPNRLDYDGTPSSYVKNEINEHAFDLNLQTVELIYDKHVTESPTSNNPILFLHGLFGSKSNNRTVAKTLSKKLNRDVYCLDLRNFGDSPHSTTMDLPSMCADVENFMYEQQLEEPIIMGHSMGAKVAMGVALRQPDLVSLMISVDNAPVDLSVGAAGYSVFGKYVNQLRKIESNPNLKSLKDCDRVLAEVEPSVGIRQFLLTNMKKESDGPGYKSRIPLEIIAKNLDNVAAFPFANSDRRYPKPALFVRGTESAYVADEYLQSIAQYFPKFDCVDVKAGHWLISEKPDEFVDVVSRWIDFKEDY